MARRPPAPAGDRLMPVVILILLVLLARWLARPHGPAPPTVAVPSARDGYLFCTWNVENFFDDRDDPRNHDADEDWMGRNPDVVAEKVARLAEALQAQNGGRGPDILAMVEVESLRCLALLRDALNARLPAAWHYRGIAFRGNHAERRLAPAVLTRLPLDDDGAPRSFGARRILETRLVVDGAPLTLLVSHWTSRLTDHTGAKRAAYGRVLDDTLLDLEARDPGADVLLAGDFNDEPGDPSVREGLRAGPLPARAGGGWDRNRARPHWFDLMAGRDPLSFGTYFERGRWEVLDHIVVTPGLLDPDGWQVRPETLRVANDSALRFGRNRRPWRFGSPNSSNPRGPSDHFAVTVRLRVSSAR